MFQTLQFMTVRSALALQFRSSDIFGSQPKSCNFLSVPTTNFRATTILAKSKHNTRQESAKILNRRRLKKFNGTATKPRLSVFCSTKQLYAMVVDDQNKKCLFYGSTLQKSFRGDPASSTIEVAERVGEGLVKACTDLNINEVSYDRNGFACGERMQAFEIAISRHGFLPDRDKKLKDRRPVGIYTITRTSSNIQCQTRHAAMLSAVCCCLGIKESDGMLNRK